MRGLALEGGGARGAYHIGVAKSLFEKGYVFDGFVGTSIGAINAAMLAQGDFDKVLELWISISLEAIFDTDEQPLIRFADMKGLKPDWNLTSIARRKALLKIINGRGINTDKMKAFLEQYINEEKIRESGKDFGLVTVSLSDRKPHELMLEDIPQGQLMSLNDDVILKAGKTLGNPDTPPKRMLFEKIIPQLSTYMKLGRDFDYADFVIALLERMAEQKEINRYQVYDYDQLCSLVQKAPAIGKGRKLLARSRLSANSVLSKKKTAIELLSKTLWATSSHQ